jgi:hypothetical protein
MSAHAHMLVFFGLAGEWMHLALTQCLSLFLIRFSLLPSYASLRPLLDLLREGLRLEHSPLSLETH